MSAAPGRFVVVEGPEGAGKTTLARALGERIAAAGHELVRVREPGGTPAAEQARAALLDHAHPVGPAAELFLVLAARADLVAQVIRPALARGAVVLADRFELSTRAYQIAGRGLDADAVERANRLATGGLVPNLTLVLDVPPAIGAARQAAEGKTRDRMEREPPDFHARVAAVYLAASGETVRHLDAVRHPREVLDDAWNAVRAVLPGRGVGVIAG